MAGILLLTLWGGTAVDQSPAPPAPAAPLKVVTTTTVFADIIRNVGGDRVDVVSIIPPGVGPEDFEPTPQDAILLDDAALIVSGGAGLDDFLAKLLASGDGGLTPRLVLADGVPPLLVDGKANPHFWLDPSLVVRYSLPAIVDALSGVDPDGAAAYAQNATTYGASLTALDGELAALVQQLPEANRKLVTFHDAYPYLAAHYGFQLVGVILRNVGAEPTATELAALVETVKAAGVRAVFSEAQFSPELASTLADEAGITTLVTTLYNDALGPPPADTYAGMLRIDIEQIVAALR